MTPLKLFAHYVEEAYEHLYDFPYLGEHPIAQCLLPDYVSRRKDNGWKVHQLLLLTIEQLAPSQTVPVFSREWRRQRLIVLRYVDGLPIESVAIQLAVSRRQYYRLLADAFAALTTLLRGRVAEHIEDESQSVVAQPDLELPSEIASSSESADHVALLRLETARLKQSQQFADLGAVLDGVLEIIADQLAQRGTELIIALVPNLPRLTIGQNLLRQLLLGLLDYYSQLSQHVSVTVNAVQQQERVGLSVRAEPMAALESKAEAESLNALLEMARLDAENVIPEYAHGLLIGLTLQLSTQPARNVLIVDDNQDVLALFQHYLNLHNYQPFSAHDTHEATRIAEGTPLYAILLDLMMPGQDGWDLLRAFLSNPVTQDVPVIVCSVLRQRHLALSLGATLFLEKPISEEMLASALDSLSAS